MKLVSQGPNCHEVHSDTLTVLFSYATPVAAIIYGPDPKAYRTAEKHSPTTSKHINQFLDGRHAEELPQENFDRLVIEPRSPLA